MPASYGLKFEKDLTSFYPFEISCIENIMENGAFALLEQMLHFQLYFQIQD